MQLDPVSAALLGSVDGGVRRASQGARVTIVMCTYNGARYLSQQLASLTTQTHRAWDLIVSDDGSQDGTPWLVAQFAKRVRAKGHGVFLTDGPRRGASANFVSAFRHVPAAAEWLALSDQDDVWLPDRLARGMAALRDLPQDHPALYCSRTVIADKYLRAQRLSKLPRTAPSFRNALVQNIAAGNTILLNRAGTDLVREAAREMPGGLDLPAHDWWIYQLITGAGGCVVFDEAPTLIYRQHETNQLGANDSWRARLKRIKMVFEGRFQRWISANITALEHTGAGMTEENQRLLYEFGKARKKGPWTRCRQFAQLKLHRQTRLSQASLWLALILGRL